MRARDVSALPQAIIAPLMQRWTHYAQYLVSVAYDQVIIEMDGGDMSIFILRTISLVFASVGPRVSAPFLESVVHPAVLRIAADGGTWDSVDRVAFASHFLDSVPLHVAAHSVDRVTWESFQFASHFVELLRNILKYPSHHCMDVLVRHDVISCMKRLLTVRYFIIMAHFCYA